MKAQSWSRVYKQTFIDTYKVALCKLHDRKTPIAAADLLNDSVLPFLDEHDVKLLRVLTDGGGDFCGNPERHEYELYLAVEGMDHSHTRPRARIPKVSASASARPHSLKPVRHHPNRIIYRPPSLFVCHVRTSASLSSRVLAGMSYLACRR